MLHITNGASAGDTIATLELGPVLTWDDPLHDGPVPANLPLATLSAVRSTYLAETVTTFAEAWARFSARDAAIGSLADEVVLWFEADLYDQLQILQILDALPDVPASMICIGDFPGVNRFIGLGQLNAKQLASLYPARQPVTADQIALARRCWAAFRQPTPNALRKIAYGDLSTLPFLADALKRLIAELPNPASGLSLTERTILELLPGTPLDLFQRSMDREARPYLGDTHFWQVIDRLGSGPAPLVRPVAIDLTIPLVKVVEQQRLRRTKRGDAVLAGADRWVGPGRWWGGSWLG